MKNTTTARFVALGLSAVLVLAGCSAPVEPKTPTTTTAADDSAPAAPTKADLDTLKAVTITGEPGKTPTMEFTVPLTVSTTVLHIIEPGTGDEIKAGETVSMHSIAAYASSGEVISGSDTYLTAPQTVELNPEKVFPILIDGLVGQKVGVRAVFVNPQADPSTPDSGVVMALEVVGSKETPVPLERAAGKTVEPAAGLPTVTLDETGKPSLTIPKGFEAPTELISQVLIEGEGEKVALDQTITAHYSGWKMDGTEFETSWGSTPLTLPLAQLVKGWGQGLEGTTVGSQVLLVIPPELGYGGTPGHEFEKETLIFVLDILAVA